VVLNIKATISYNEQTHHKKAKTKQLNESSQIYINAAQKQQFKTRQTVQ